MTTSSIDLKQLLPARIVVTWVILVLAAVVGPLLTLDSHGGTVSAIVVLAIAAIKVRLVGLDFMELRHAPWELRAAFRIYCVALWLVLSGFSCFSEPFERTRHHPSNQWFDTHLRRKSWPLKWRHSMS